MGTAAGLRVESDEGTAVETKHVVLRDEITVAERDPDLKAATTDES